MPYMFERTAMLSKFRSSGVAVQDPAIDALASGKGKLFDLPFWQDIAGPNQNESQVLDDSTGITTRKITATEQVAMAHQRGDGWSSNSLVTYLTAEDPMKAIADRVAEYWAIDEQKMIIATADGVFADNTANDASDLVNSKAIETTVGITDADNKIDAQKIIDTEALMGDAGAKLGAIAMHSTPYYRLRKLDLIDFIPDSESKSQIPTYMGKRVIVDDMLKRAGTDGGTPSTVYKTYLFAEGAFQLGEGNLSAMNVEGGFGTEALELARDASAGVNKMYVRRRFIIHPHGFQFILGSIAGVSPTNTELALAAHWNRVMEKKNVRVVMLLTNG